METIEIIYPDDWHCHLREGALLESTVPVAAKQFKRIMVMPNLSTPLTTLQQIKNYKAQINAHIPSGSDLIPLLTLYLTDHLSPILIDKAKEAHIFACKLYPAGATTHADSGVTELAHIYPVLEAMSEAGVPLLIHGEVNDPSIDIFDREQLFIDRHLSPLLARFPGLKVVLEHITTKEAVDFIKEGPSTLAATLTPHHLLLNRNDLFSGGIRPHHYCLPILKRKKHQEALIHAAISGNPKFFIGTDSAPHPQTHKEAQYGCAGIYHPYAVELYAHIFEQANSLEKLEGFTSIFGARFYGLPINQEKCRLQKNSWTVPEALSLGTERVIPFWANQILKWQRVT